jgi:hypothetical protein
VLYVRLLRVSAIDERATTLKKPTVEIQQGRDWPRQDHRGFSAVAGQVGAAEDAKVMLMESQDESVYRMTGQQVEEIQRRRADPNPRRLTLDEFKKRLSRRSSE